MALFKRLRDLTMANINALLDKAEDPVKMLDQYLRDMEEDIQDAESAVAKQIAVEKKLQQQYLEAEELATKREAQALQALEAGNEDLARRALVDKKAMAEKAADFKAQYESAKTVADGLRGKLGEMKEQLGEMKNKRDTLKARAEAAKAQKQINQTLSGIGSNNAAAGFSRMEDKVLQLEAEAEASNEVSGSKSLDREFAELNKNNTSEIDAELEALKAKLKK
ncbi:phage shock protein A (PspA) family protein [Tumebacillus sp. BK434]|uniref:PspA/IM30 family protein n=1 Tax=Tumebacillus sp. BK434 TaxID=2512169 RepID=UPI00104DFF6F|nr:PspA/IM30 family protein [Tumebacillus sp. BK434]TCP54722.1 phage shock protein A (PspA) family protein [Tumebacillus sp. BK434]